MQEEKGKVSPAGMKIDGCGGSDDSNHNACGGENSVVQSNAGCNSEKSRSDCFYEKLNSFHESSGLSLVFNFREANLDLYQLYNDVAGRGGFQQVTKDGKWCEVVASLKYKSGVPLLPTRLENFYYGFLHQFEQIYHYRTPAKITVGPGSGNSSICTRKRKHSDSSSSLLITQSGTMDGLSKKKQCNDESYQLPTGSKKTGKRNQPKKKDLNKVSNVPQGRRTAYQIFLKNECYRLKQIHGETLNGKKMKKVAIDAWRCLSESDKQPYMEASQKDKERFIRQMAAYMETEETQSAEVWNTASSSKSNVINIASPIIADGDYHVSLQLDDDDDTLDPDEHTIKSALELMKNAQPNDPIFQMNWDGHCDSPDISS